MSALDEFVTRHRFTADDFHRMAEVGLFPDNARLELLDGEIVEMSPIGFPHFRAVNEINRRLVEACGDRAVVSIQLPIRLSTWTEPQPDAAVYRAVPGGYRDWPKPEDTLLVIEVADTTLRYDRLVKLGYYARHGISEYWILDVKAGRTEAYTEPTGEGYARSEVFVPEGRRRLAASGSSGPIEVDLSGLF